MLDDGRIITHHWEKKPGIKKKVFYKFDEEIELPIGIDDPALWFNAQEENGWKLRFDGKRSKRTLQWPVKPLRHRYLPTTRLYATDKGRRETGARLLNGEDRINEAFAEEINKRWLIYYSQTLNEVKQIQAEGLRAALHHSLSITHEIVTGPNINPSQAYERVQKFLRRQASGEAELLGPYEDFFSRYEKDESIRRVVDNINNVELRIETAMFPVQQFTNTINKLFSREKQVQPTDNGLLIELKSGKKISPAHLSSGEKHLLLILLNAMTVGSNAILIDEPELSMHIDWQYNLAEKIRILNPDCQLILASHSPEIMAQIDDGCIFKL